MVVYFRFVFVFSSRRRHTRCALVTGVQTCALPISTSPLPHTGQLTSLRRRWSSQSSVEPNHASKPCADEQRISKTIICLAPEPKHVGGGGWPERSRVHPQPPPCQPTTKSEARHAGKECDWTGRSLWSPIN